MTRQRAKKLDTKSVLQAQYKRLIWDDCITYSLNVSRAPIMAIGYRQCLPLSVVQLKVKHFQKTHCRNGVVDTIGHTLL